MTGTPSCTCLALVAELQAADRAYRLDEMTPARQLKERRRRAIADLLSYPIPATLQVTP